MVDLKLNNNFSCYHGATFCKYLLDSRLTSLQDKKIIADLFKLNISVLDEIDNKTNSSLLIFVAGNFLDFTHARLFYLSFCLFIAIKNAYILQMEG